MPDVKALKIAAAICLAATSLASLGPGAGASQPVPKPKLRPALAGAAAPAVSVPIPRLKPDAPAVQTPPAAAQPEARHADEAGWAAEAVAAGRAECTALLAGLDLDYTPAGPIGKPGGCGAPAPIIVTSVAGVKLVPPATQTRAMAAALASWVKDSVQPAAHQRLGTEVTAIRTATSYACRRRNNSTTGKMSEHSKANALDMSGFSFAKSAGVSVGGKDNWGEGLLGAIGLPRSGSFLEDIRKAACTHFTTVLGPGSDPFHGDHFHVDVLQRKGGYRICQ